MLMKMKMTTLIWWWWCKMRMTTLVWWWWWRPTSSSSSPLNLHHVGRMYVSRWLWPQPTQRAVLVWPRLKAQTCLTTRSSLSVNICVRCLFKNLHSFLLICFVFCFFLCFLVSFPFIPLFYLFIYLNSWMGGFCNNRMFFSNRSILVI